MDREIIIVLGSLVGMAFLMGFLLGAIVRLKINITVEKPPLPSTNPPSAEFLPNDEGGTAVVEEVEEDDADWWKRGRRKGED